MEQPDSAPYLFSSLIWRAPEVDDIFAGIREQLPAQLRPDQTQPAALPCWSACSTAS